MKKVLLVTLQSDNIGCRLQNYALQEILTAMDCEVWTPFYDTGLNCFSKKMKTFIKICLGSIGVKRYRPNAYRHKRLRKYAEFNHRYISNRFPLKYADAFKRDWKEFDFAVTGSDQVWHRWSEEEKELEYFYLKFVEADKRIAYAPSFGFDRFPDRDVKVHTDGICGIPRLSCREEKGRELVRELTGREAEVLLDPTLLLDRQQWSRIGKKPDRFLTQKSYILIYFLGEKTDDYMDSVKALADGSDLEVIDVYDVYSLESQITTPDEFVWLVEHASYVCTDSFHAVVFSILFGKKFLAYRRCQTGMDKMFDRIENILKIYGLTDRVYDGDIGKIHLDYKASENGRLREFSLSYLEESLRKG